MSNDPRVRAARKKKGGADPQVLSRYLSMASWRTKKKPRGKNTRADV